MSTAAIRQKIKALERKRQVLRRQEARLVKDRQYLLIRNAVVTAWCEALTLLQVKQGQDGDSQQQGQDEAIREEFQLLLNKEMQLLQQLTLNDRLTCCSAASRAMLPDLPDPGPDALSPGDPMSYFKTCVADGPDPDAVHWTPLYVATKLRETVLLGSMYLNQKRLPVVSKPIEMREHWDRYLRMLISLVIVGRTEVCEAISAVNLDTLEFKPEYAIASEKLIATLPARANLTDVQKDIISVGIEVCETVTASLRQEREHVMLQMKAGAAYCPHALTGREHHLEDQQRLAARLQLLMAKQYMLVLTTGGLMLGCLTCEQMSLLSALAWPYSIQIHALGLGIRNLRMQELQQQEQLQPAIS